MYLARECLYLNSMGGSWVDVQSWGSVVGKGGPAECCWGREAHRVTGIRQTCATERSKGHEPPQIQTRVKMNHVYN